MYELTVIDKKRAGQRRKDRDFLCLPLFPETYNTPDIGSSLDYFGREWNVGSKVT